MLPGIGFVYIGPEFRHTQVYLLVPEYSQPVPLGEGNQARKDIGRGTPPPALLKDGDDLLFPELLEDPVRRLLWDPRLLVKLRRSEKDRSSKGILCSKSYLAGEDGGFTDQLATVIGACGAVQIVLEPPGVFSPAPG